MQRKKFLQNKTFNKKASCTLISKQTEKNFFIWRSGLRLLVSELSFYFKNLHIS